uniref:Reverse transcriptase Ty1/copia-type domain-containing protein n=1 Tax=Solanum lycopersicum TaxID=4081 RepID=A0A3Q7IG58_SOLLC
MKDLGPLRYFLRIEVKYFAVVRLQYLILTRLDITHDFIQSPNIQHLQGVKRILRYIKGTIHLRLRIISQSPCRLYGYSDADLGGCTTTRRSTIGYSINVGANCIFSTFKKQNTIGRSSTETEHRELASTAA